MSSALFLALCQFEKALPRVSSRQFDATTHFVYELYPTDSFSALETSGTNDVNCFPIAAAIGILISGRSI